MNTRNANKALLVFFWWILWINYAMFLNPSLINFISFEIPVEWLSAHNIPIPLPNHRHLLLSQLFRPLRSFLLSLKFFQALLTFCENNLVLLQAFKRRILLSIRISIFFPKVIYFFFQSLVCVLLICKSSFYLSKLLIYREHLLLKRFVFIFKTSHL